jgi:hypothetical protein
VEEEFHLSVFLWNAGCSYRRGKGGANGLDPGKVRRAMFGPNHEKNLGLGFWE